MAKSCSICGKKLSFLADDMSGELCTKCAEEERISGRAEQAAAQAAAQAVQDRRGMYLRVATENDAQIQATLTKVASPLAIVLARYIGQEIALNVVEPKCYVSAKLVAVTDHCFSTSTGPENLSHYPLTQIMEIRENPAGTGVLVQYIGQIYPLLIVLTPQAQVISPSSSTSFGIITSLSTSSS